MRRVTEGARRAPDETGVVSVMKTTGQGRSSTQPMFAEDEPVAAWSPAKEPGPRQPISARVEPQARRPATQGGERR